MNKKFMSFVLAMLLSVGLGVGSAFAYSYSDYADDFNSSYASETGEKSVTLNVGKASDLLGGNLTGVFGYYAGSLISYQGAGGQFQLYDSYGARFSVNNAGGSWNVTGMNLRQSDLAQMEGKTAEEFLKSAGFSETSLAVAAMDKEGNLLDDNGTPIKQIGSLNEYVNKDGSFDSKRFLADVGRSNEGLKFKSLDRADDDGDGKKDDGVTDVHFTNEDGEDVKLSATDVNKAFMAQMGTVKISDGWWSKLKDTLKSGVNFSASVQVGSGVTGPTLTISENGKPMAAYVSDQNWDGGLRQTTLYRYDDKGFQIGVQTATFEMDETSNGTAKGKWQFNYTATTYDISGVRTDTSYSFFNWSDDPQKTIKSSSIPPATPDNKKVSESTPAMVTSVTTYSANNSALSTIDYTTNNTTFYANNRPSYVINETGTTVGLYEYSANGVIQAYFNAVGTADGTDGTAKVGTTTIFDKWGRQLFTATGGGVEDPNGENPFKNKALRDSLISEYNDYIANGYQKEGKHKTAADFEYETKEGQGVFTPKKGTGTRISNISVYSDQLLSNAGPGLMTNGFIDMAKVANALKGLDLVADGSLADVNVSGEKAIKDMEALLSEAETKNKHIDDSGTNGKGATDAADVTTILNDLGKANKAVDAAWKDYEKAVASGASKKDIQKKAAIYKRATEIAEEISTIAVQAVTTATGEIKYNNGKNTKVRMSSFNKTVNGKKITSTADLKDYVTKLNNDTKSTAVGSLGKINSLYANRKGSSIDVLNGALGGALNTNLMKFGYTAMDFYNMLKFSNGGSTALAQTQIAMSSWDGDNIPENADASDVTYDSNSTQNATGSTHNTHVQWSVQSRSTNSNVAAAGMTFTNTILLGGAQAYSTQHNVITNVYEAVTENVQSESDPAVRGTFQGTWTDPATGKTYVKVSASEVNIMDGNGFQTADGETVLVDIDTLPKDKKDAIMSMKEGDEIMFMGDVRKSADGKSFTMAVNTSYSGGVAMGSEIADMREAIQNGSLDWVKENTAINTALIGDQNIGGDWKSGWNILVNANKKDPKDFIPAEDLNMLF